ncbi:ABC transporter ATP-binding protein [Pseudoalteromonas tunicata]|uniref:ABC transporter ATP-binding protein n=1 Tax=Pseudoalteromonas tunicata TaxID=314281 RepID=UPI00273E9FF0|nr:ABC transporter ATP-binding protein [Pseudoalteromonas tunicata]MDP5215018.1 ABC transporter ATP-binding protein [Pseudoalteromonas tunicata]
MITLSELQFCWPGAAKKNIDIKHLHIEQGQHVFIYGPSGSGKSTLLSLLAGINRPSAGEIVLLGQAQTGLSNRQRDQFRADHIGYIFQNFNLIPYLNAIENVTLATEFSTSRKQRVLQIHKSIACAAKALLQALELPDEVLMHPVVNLSIGQQQRVAAARAFIGQPEIIIADEPTSALDSDSRNRFIELLFEQATINNATILFVSHDTTLAPLFEQKLAITAQNLGLSS